VQGREQEKNLKAMRTK